MQLTRLCFIYKICKIQFILFVQWLPKLQQLQHCNMHYKYNYNLVGNEWYRTHTQTHRLVQQKHMFRDI